MQGGGVTKDKISETDNIKFHNFPSVASVKPLLYLQVQVKCITLLQIHVKAAELGEKGINIRNSIA